jgi:hypothetical protein
MSSERKSKREIFISMAASLDSFRNPIKCDSELWDQPLCLFWQGIPKCRSFFCPMLRKKVLGVGTYSATLLVEDTENGNQLRVLRRINVSGWGEQDCHQTVGVYNALHKTGRTAFRVTIDSVQLQNSFLNVLCEYCAEGSVADHLGRLKQPLATEMVVSWLLVIASSALETQSQGYPHCGINARNIFLRRSNRDTSGQAEHHQLGVLVGLPLPVCCYLQRKREMAGMESSAGSACPPEVLQSDVYDLHKSDVWHVGNVAKELLLAGCGADVAGSSPRPPSLLALVDEMLEANAARRLPLTDVIASLTTIQQEVGSGASIRTPTAVQHVTPGRKGRVGAPRPVLDSAAINTGAAVPSSNIDAVWQKRAQAQFAELQSLQQRSAKPAASQQQPPQSVAAAATDSSAPAPAYQPGGYSNSSTMQMHHAQPQQRRHRSPSPQAPVTSLSSPRAGAQPLVAASLLLHHHQFSPAATMSSAGVEAAALSPRPTRSSSKPRVGMRGAAAPQQLFEDPAAMRRREAIEKEAATKRAKQLEESRVALQAQKLHQEKMKALQSQRGKVGVGGHAISTEIRKSIRSWQQASAVVGGSETDHNVVISSEGGVAIYSKYPRNANLPRGEVEDPPGSPMSDMASPPAGDGECSEGSGEANPPRATAKVYRPMSTALLPKGDSNAGNDVSPPRQHQPSALVPRPAPPVSGEAPVKTAGGMQPVARELALLADEPTTSSGAIFVSKQPPSQQQHQHPSRATIGVIATLEWSLDTLTSSLRHLMDPPVFDEMHCIIREFASRPASDRYSAKVNADLLSALTNLLGDDEALSAAIPLCCQLVALESVWRLSEDLLKMRSS